MKYTPDGRILVVADTSFLVNFLVLDRLDILRGLRRYAFHVPNHVVAEVRYEEQRRRLHAAMDEGGLTELEITDLTETSLYMELRQFLDDGESACLAVAVSRSWVIAADEKGRLRREIFTRLGEEYLLNTPGALVAALRAGILMVSEAEEIRRQLALHRFVMADVPPFEELLYEGE